MAGLASAGVGVGVLALLAFFRCRFVVPVPLALSAFFLDLLEGEGLVPAAGVGCAGAATLAVGRTGVVADIFTVGAMGLLVFKAVGAVDLGTTVTFAGALGIATTTGAAFTGKATLGPLLRGRPATLGAAPVCML